MIDLLSPPAFGPVPQAPLVGERVDPFAVAADGLVGFWPMADGAGRRLTDFSRHGVHGALVNGPQWSADSPPGGCGSLDFDGTTHDVNIGNASSLDLSELTIAAWIKPDSYGEHANGLGRIVDKSSGVTVYWTFSLNKDFAGLGTNNLIFFDGDELEVSTSSVIGLNVWQHVAVTANATDVKFYVNGVQQGGDTGTHTLGQSASTDVVIGAAGSGAALHFNGRIGQVVIADRAFSVAEIRGLFWGSRQGYPNLLERGRRSVYPVAVAPPVGNPWYYYTQQEVVA